MKTTKRILSILLACVMLACVMPMAVSAAGTQDDPIDAKTKWMGYGVDAYVLNPTIAEGSDGMWYTLTAESDGILVLDHSYKNVDYTIYITLNGVTYEGGCVDGEPYNRPIVTAPIKVGDIATIQIATKDAAAGTVYASMNIIAGDLDNTVKVKSDGLSVVVGAGKTVYFQDDSLNAIYATKGLQVQGNVNDVTFYTVSKSSESDSAVEKPFTDSDADGIIEAKLGGSLGSAGAPAVKPAWAIENASNEDRVFILTIVSTAHECNWDNATDTDCNTCGAIREVVQSCQHSYDNTCDADCNLCGEVRATEHTYSSALDVDCDVCGAVREVELPFAFNGASISEDVDGLACRFDLEAEGLTANNAVAVYDNATFYGLKLVSMGAVACNNYKEGSPLPTIEDANGKNTLNIPAKYLCEFNQEAGTAAYAIRIVNIPDNQKDTDILFVPYVVVEDDAGTQHTLYFDRQIHSYNGAAN
ncbi:MAG: hypothetical protein IIX28_01130 [Clostridia bacterium]|nr:hypothetical protein [Clostridia bacterium]